MGEYEKNSNTAPRERSLTNLLFMKATTFQMLKKEQKTTTKKPHMPHLTITYKKNGILNLS